jgi:hypothetical protein
VVVESRTARLPAGIPKFIQVVSSPTKPLERLLTCATINEVSRLFTFNEEQHRGFIIAARALLASIENESSEKEDEQLADLQQLCFYHGKGGSGKSHLIRASTALADIWSRFSGVQIFARTGIAAVNISGRTLASLLCSFKRWRSASQSVRLRYSATKMLILDEISVVPWLDLTDLDSFYRTVMKRPNVPFGGEHIVLAGHFHQLPPICNVTMPPIEFEPATTFTAASATAPLWSLKQT